MAADHAAELNKSLEQRLVGAMRLRVKEAAWRRKEQGFARAPRATTHSAHSPPRHSVHTVHHPERALAHCAWCRLLASLEAARSTHTTREAEMVHEAEQSRVAAAERESELSKQLERERASAAERAAECARAASNAHPVHAHASHARAHPLTRAACARRHKRGLEAAKMAAETREATKDASWRRKEVELNRMLEAVRAQAAHKESDLHRELEATKRAAAEREAELSRLLERERSSGAEQALEFKRALDAQRHAAETMETELHQSLNQQRHAAEARATPRERCPCTPCT